MGKATKKKQQALEARQPDFSSILLRAKGSQAHKEFELASFDPMSYIRGYEHRAIRSLNTFTPRTRSLNKSTRGKELVRYAFNKYSPPPFLYNVWDTERNNQYDYLFGLKEDFKLWYLALAQGRSLYKECTMGLLTKRETFYFSTCIYSMTIPQAIWYSVIRCLDEKAPASLARKIATTKLAEHPIDDFWKGVARWFMNHPASIRQMNDLLDYIRARHIERRDWYLKDQTLPGLQRAMQSWHRELYRMRNMATEFQHWEGIEVPDSDWTTGEGKNKIKWNLHQIKTGKELAIEGNKQHHCVSAYARSCVDGKCSIWSMTQEGIRALTIEVASDMGTDRVIVQARGYANRPPRPDEMTVLKSWASTVGFRIRST